MQTKKNYYDEVIINEILDQCSVVAKRIQVFQSNDRVHDYLINNHLMLRLSSGTLDEIQKLLKVKSLEGIQKIYGYGHIKHQDKTINYVLLDFYQGLSLYDSIPMLSHNEAIQIGIDIADFLKQLHQIKTDHYDIGHYIPTIPKHKGSWKSGHLTYINLLQDQIRKINLSSEDRQTIDSAFNYIHQHIESLNFEEGPVLLHNDLHPKNIIINQTRFVGIIDWECSQFGSFDFDFVNLVHWCIYPNDESRKFETLLISIFNEYNRLWTIPMLSERLTIYQLEHEINQIIWSQGNKIDDRLKRINGWLSGVIHQFFKRVNQVSNK